MMHLLERFVTAFERLVDRLGTCHGDRWHFKERAEPDGKMIDFYCAHCDKRIATYVLPPR